MRESLPLYFLVALYLILLALALIFGRALLYDAHSGISRFRTLRLRQQLKEQFATSPETIAKHQLQTYRYQSLGDPESKRIRVFSLLPDGSIRIQPISLNATDTPRYEALSYCWGNPNELWALRCFEGDSQEEQILYVPQNLLYALSALLRDGFDTLLWADSICINQADTSEKSWQVSMMTDIYKNASRVIVFLGFSDGVEGKIGEVVPRLLKIKENVETVLQGGATWKDINSSPRILKELGLPDLVDRGIMLWALQDLLYNPWFRRVWIIQEIALARDAVVLCGNWALSWHELCEAYRFMEENKFEGAIWSEDQFSGTYRLEQLQESRARAGRENMASLLVSHRGTQATNPRDHVFAFVGLAADGSEFNVNYDISPGQLFIDTARHIIVDQKRLVFLCYAGLYQRTDATLPSWVPDWRTGPTSEPSLHQDLAPSCKSYASCFEMELHVKGLRIGSICFVGALAPDLPEEIEDREYSQQLLTATLARWRSSLGQDVRKFYDLAWQPTKSCVIWPSFFEENFDHDPSIFSYFEVTSWVSMKIMSFPLPLRFERICNWIVFFVHCFELAIRAYYRVRGWQVVKVIPNEICWGRRLLEMDQGTLGLGLRDVQVGDEVFLLHGVSHRELGSIPMVLRSAGDGKYWLVGEAYLHGYVGKELEELEECCTIVLC